MNKLTPVKAAIVPYFDPEILNLGLEKYGWVTFPNTEIIEFIGQDSTGRFLTGIDPFGYDLRGTVDEEERTAKVEERNNIIKRLEQVYGEGALDARNNTFWSAFSLDIKDNYRALDFSMPKDELIFHAIRAGGFEEVAPTYEEAQNSPKLYKYYLKIAEEEAAIKTQLTKITNKAKGLLTDLTEKDPKKVFYISKLLLSPNNEFRLNTPVDVLYEKLDMFIDGQIVKTNKKETASQFLAAVKMSKEDLTLHAITIDAIFYRVLYDESGNYYNKQTETRLGKNIKEIVEFLKNPINATELENIEARVREKWGK
jgi:hypothetical protein